MATTTPNFGWQVPTSTDYVKDGAVAIETLGDAIDASLVDLKGGTTGQLLSKNSNTDLDFTYTTVGNGLSGGATLAIDTAVVADLTTAQTLANKVLQGPEELVNVVASAATGTINIDANTAGVWYYTSNASANFTLNFRASSTVTLATKLAVGEAITLVFMNTNGTTPYYPNTFQIDGSSATIKWQGGSAPTSGNASSVDVYTFTIIKTAATPTYVVLGAQTRFA